MEDERALNLLGENADRDGDGLLELVEDYFGDHVREGKLLAQPIVCEVSVVMRDLEDVMRW